ncbi:MAG: efflux transporter outer membrane subunit [Rickettsiales bacterium]
MNARFGLFLFASCYVASCSLVPEYARPRVDAPNAWTKDAPVVDAVAKNWPDDFGSDELRALIARALKENLDLTAGTARVKQAQAALDAANAALWPSLSVSANASRAENRPANGRSRTDETFNAAANLSYDIDAFGANRAGKAAARANVDKSRYAQDALAITVGTQVASGYFTYLNAEERIAVTRNALANATEALGVVKTRVDVGSEFDSALAEQKTLVAGREAELAALEEQRDNAKNALALLLGSPPSAISLRARNTGGVTIPSVAALQPSELLERRPDLAASEAALKAADANIGAARAAFFPSIDVGSAASAALVGAGGPASTAMSLGASVFAPIFTAGRLQAGVALSNAQKEELVAAYRQSVLRAFTEAEDALSAVKSAKTQEERYAEARENARVAYRLAKKRYDAGAADYQTLLSVQKTLFDAENALSRARLARLLGAVSLYKAMGGGWESSKKILRTE